MLWEAYYTDVIAGKYPGVEAMNKPDHLQFDKDGTLLTPYQGRSIKKGP